MTDTQPFNTKCNPYGSKNKRSTNDMHPVFSLEKMTEGHSHCVPKCPEKQLVFVLKKLFLLSRLTWHQIRNANRHKLGTETIAIKSILNKKGISQCPKDATIICIRYHSIKPMVGYREGRIFHILCIDHDCTAYKHGH